MSYWSHNPELLDEITTNFLPEPWKTKVLEGEILCSDIPNEILLPVVTKAVEDYWGSMIDEATMRKKEER